MGIERSGVRIMNKRRVINPKDIQQPINANMVSSPYYKVSAHHYSDNGSHKSDNSAISADGKKSFEYSKISDLFAKTDMSINSALVGGAIGLGVALYRRQQYFISIFIGGAIGLIGGGFLFKNYKFEKK